MARWHSCNILQSASGASRLWQFDAKGGDFVLSREHPVADGETLPARFVAKSWSSLWQPRLNVAWLPPETVFLRAVELPKSNFDETLAMVELQLEKLSPLPVAQIVWTIQLLPAAVENLQTVVVVIAERSAAEEFLGKLETQGFLADRLEVPMLDQLQTTAATGDGAWIYPDVSGGKNTALVAWWSGGALRNLSFVILPAARDRAASLKNQLGQLVWAGELEGWLTANPQWHLVAEPTAAAEWEPLLHESLGELVEVSPPLPAAELAARTARRAAAGAAPTVAALLPLEFSTRYRQQFVDRLWLHGLAAAGILYAVIVAIYFCATGIAGYQTRNVEEQVAAIGGSYTNALLLKARYDVLKERQDLKYAALDSWKLVAEQLPPDISLDRFSFADGQRLSLSGKTTPEQIPKVTDFSDTLRKAQLNGQRVFDAAGGDPFQWRQNGGTVSWSFSLLLQHTDEGGAP